MFLLLILGISNNFLDSVSIADFEQVNAACLGCRYVKNIVYCFQLPSFN